MSDSPFAPDAITRESMTNLMHRLGSIAARATRSGSIPTFEEDLMGLLHEVSEAGAPQWVREWLMAYVVGVDEG